MAPSPENDNTPKAPDKTKSEKPNVTAPRDAAKDEKTLSNLNDRELKALLDEAITYKNPKDREGKSELFNDLLLKAEETERIARAASAGGSELVRHCNPSARRRDRHRRKPSSISENVMHGGSLDNLAKEELFESTHHHLHITRKPGRVSARQREGGSLPCNVNSSVTPSRDYQFLEEAKKNKAMKDKEYTAIDMETESLLENDHLAQTYQDQVPPIDLVQGGQFQKFTSNATLQISNVDDPIPLDLDATENTKKSFDVETLQAKLVPNKYKMVIPKPEEKKVDENGNALHHTKVKKKKTQTDKNVVVLAAESVEGHRSDIIGDVYKLMEYIEGTDSHATSGGKNKTVHKSKQLHKQHTSEDGGARGKKQRAHSSKGKESRSDLKKSNSLGEISTTKLDEFAFSGCSSTKEDKVTLRGNKTQSDRPRERRSWGNMEPPTFQMIYSTTSIENLEALDNWEVTKPKKKSKKRRNSVSSGGGGGRRQNVASESAGKHMANRAPSPDMPRKSACSMPHSEKSNDSSSDVDSVHSLPIDGPISYADIAKNSEKAKEKKPSPEKGGGAKEKGNCMVDKNNALNATKMAVMVATVAAVAVPSPPDVTNFKSFPAISSAKKENVEKKCSSKKSPPSSKAKSKNVVVQNTIDIRTDLSIIKANEKETNHLNARMLPPNIPDVQTIEKMHFMNRQSPPAMNQCEATPSNNTTNGPSSFNCDNEEGDDAGLEDDMMVEDGGDTPPVVILSGVNNEVPGLVFGFDVNEQLLKEDICENFVARFIAPSVFNETSHNHEKIVNFIGAAWESVINQSNGKILYYTEDL